MQAGQIKSDYFNQNKFCSISTLEDSTRAFNKLV
jgi:hypothetical protein